jgi:hypothetical protein
MKKLIICFSVILVSITVFCFAQSYGPSGTEKGPIKIIQSDKKEILIEPFVGDFKINENWMRQYGVIFYPKTQKTSLVKNVYAISMPFNMNDIPGGKFYIIKPSVGKQSYGWPTVLTASNAPNAEYVIADSSNFKITKQKTGILLELGETGNLKPGRYVIYVNNNKYIWDFTIEGVIQPEPAKKPSANTSPAPQNTDK